MPDSRLAHAFVLPDRDFDIWKRAAEAYIAAFAPITVVRSPKGSDLNRFFTVTAVRAPGVWFGDDPVTHIRRTFPAVIRIDVIDASSPIQLEAILAERIQRRDRLAAFRQDGHLNDRLTITWASDFRPARIVTRYGALISVGGSTRQNEGIDISTAADVVLRAPCAGMVQRPLSYPISQGYGNIVQIRTEFGGKEYLVTVTSMRLVDVEPGQNVTAGQRIGTAIGANSKIIVQENALRLQRDREPALTHTDPTPLIYWDGLRVQPTGDGLRVRQGPGTQFAILATLNRSDLAETLETHGRTLEKVTVQGEWLKLRTTAGIEGFAAAWFLNAVALPVDSVLPGVNLDPKHPLGKPTPARVQSLDWVRLVYKAVPTQGFPTMEDAHAFYDPVLSGYAGAGVGTVVVLTHQTFGEGAGFNWEDMYANDRGRWDDFIPPFVNAARSIAARYKNRGIVKTYQIWNEQDTDPANGRAAVPIQAQDYAKLFTAAARAIREIDPAAKVISGGHVRGPVVGRQYAQTTLSFLPPDARPDGFAVHPYGRGAPGAGSRYAPFGLVDDEVNAYYPLLSAPVWFTEWGVLDKPGDSAADVAAYATGFLNHLKLNFTHKVASAIWYAWADTMDNGYGLVNNADQPKQPLYEQFLGA
jgi:murein DD-endopeptidase MepM/ murein hydrolase activator NlpD